MKAKLKEKAGRFPMEMKIKIKNRSEFNVLLSLFGMYCHDMVDTINDGNKKGQEEDFTFEQMTKATHPIWNTLNDKFEEIK